jgi:ammonia channel protein AmtB
MLVDVLRRAERHPLRSAADGVLAGLVAIVPGAAGISFPWSLAVGALAGAVAALVYGLRRLSSAGRAGHWALVVLASTAVGYLAPAVSGDSIGLLFSGRIAALLPPMLAILAVAAIGVLVTAPIWAIGRRGSSAL